MTLPPIEDESIYRLVVEKVRDFAIILVSPDGVIRTWNRGAERVFGFARAAIVGSPVSTIFLPEDVGAGVPQQELETARRDGQAIDVRWHVRSGGGRVFCDGVTMAVRNPDGEVRCFAKIARDVTDRFRADQRLSAQLAVSLILRQELEEHDSVTRVLDAICTHLQYDLGVFWKIDRRAGLMRPAAHWARDAAHLEAARELSGDRSFTRGAGLPGETWALGQVCWVTDLAGENSRYPLVAAATALGLRSAMAFPITVDGEVAAVMEFFTRDLRQADKELLPVMLLIGTQIGETMERRRTSAALRDSEAKYRAISEASPDAILSIDAKGKIIFCSGGVETVFGYTPESLTGRPFDILLPDADRQMHIARLQHYMETGERSMPWSGTSLVGQRKNGEQFPLEISFSESVTSEGRVLTGFARDISDRERVASEIRSMLEHEQAARAEAEAAKAQLQRRADEEEAFRHLASALNGAVETTEVLHEIVNRASDVTRADGVYVEQIVAPSGRVRVVAIAGTGTPQLGTEVEYPGSMTEEIIEGQRPVILADMNGFGRSMAPYLLRTCSDCQVVVTPLVANHEPLGALVLLNSRRSGREFNESDVLRIRTLGDLASLALRRVRLMEEERLAKERAEAAVRVRDETLGIVSHDLRNPLTRIALSADLLVEAEAGEVHDLVETIRSSSRQAQRLIQDLLDVARVEAGRMSVRKAVIETKPLVEEACRAYQPLAQQKGITIDCTIEPELPALCADHDRLLQVFGNLLGNAVKFTPEGGVVSLEARREDGSVRFSVSDTGPGIPESDLPNLFRAYWQAKKTAHLGAGLGLAIVRGIVEAHGGRVWAGNAEHGGAVFTIVMPGT